MSNLLRIFTCYPQHDAMDCGAACLRMIAKHYGKYYSAERLRKITHLTREGVSLLGISDAAENLGMRTIGVKTIANLHWKYFVFSKSSSTACLLINKP